MRGVPFFPLIASLLLATIALVLWRVAADAARRRAADEPASPPTPPVAATVSLGLVILIGLGALAVSPSSLRAASGVGCFGLPAHLGLMAFAGGALVLRSPHRRGGDGTGCAVLILWGFTFGVGACYTMLLSHNGMWH